MAKPPGNQNRRFLVAAYQKMTTRLADLQQITGLQLRCQTLAKPAGIFQLDGQFILPPAAAVL